MPNELVLTTQITDIVELNQEVRPNWDDYFTLNSINFDILNEKPSMNLADLMI
jgi:hypothetical protein